MFKTYSIILVLFNICSIVDPDTAEFLGQWNSWGTEYLYNIYDNGTNQSSTINVLENYIKCNFREFDYSISMYILYDKCKVYV